MAATTTLDYDRLWRGIDFVINVHPQLRFTQFRFLLYVKQNPNRSLTEIANDLGQTLPAISRAIDVFGTPKKGRNRDLALGYVLAERSPLDDRIITVSLTLKGEHFFNQFALNYDSLQKP